MHLHFVSPYSQSSGLSSPFSNGVYLDSSQYKTTEKFEHEIENRRHLSVTRESCPVRPLKPQPALGTRVKLQPHRERTVYISANVCILKNILFSPGGVVIWRSFPVLADLLTVELGNFPKSRINGGSFRILVRTFWSSYTGKNQGILHWISERGT